MSELMANDASALLAQGFAALEPSLAASDANDVRTYLEHGEYGVAWELLWHIVQEDKLDVPSSLVTAGQVMGLLGQTAG